MDGTQIGKIAVALVCFLCAAGVVAAFLWRRHRLEKWIKVDATVYGAWTRRHGGPNAGVTHHVEYIFSTLDGQRRQGTGVTHDEHQENDVIDIWYDPADPYRSKASFSDVKIWYYARIPAVLMFLALGVLGLLDGLARPRPLLRLGSANSASNVVPVVLQELAPTELQHPPQRHPGHASDGEPDLRDHSHDAEVTRHEWPPSQPRTE